MASADLVATWTVALADKRHKVEFEHGTTSGKRVIRVDGQVSLLPNALTSYLHSCGLMTKFRTNLCSLPFVANVYRGI